MNWKIRDRGLIMGGDAAFYEYMPCEGGGHTSFILVWVDKTKVAPFPEGNYFLMTKEAQQDVLGHCWENNVCFETLERGGLQCKPKCQQHKTTFVLLPKPMETEAPITKGFFSRLLSFLKSIV